MADDNDEVLDLSSGAHMVRLPGQEAPVPVEQLMSKSVFTQKTQELAQQKAQMEAAYAPAAQLFQALQEDPVGFYQELGQRMGLSQEAATNMGTQVQQMVDDTGLDMNDPRIARAIQAQMAPLLADLDGMKKFVMNKSARDSIAVEINQIRQMDPQLTQDQVTEVITLAQQMGAKDLVTAYKVWDHSRLVGTARKLSEDLEATKRKAMYPELGGSSEQNIRREPLKGKPNEILQGLFEANARKLGLA